MWDALARQLNGWVYGAFGAEGLARFQEHAAAFGLAMLLVIVALAAAMLWWSARRVRRAWHDLRRWSALVRSRAGRRALALAAEIRRAGRRVRRTVAASLADPGERRELLRLLERFLRSDLAWSLDALQGWAAIGGAIRVRALERQLEMETARWGALPEGGTRRAAEQSVAGIKQQLALARRATEDHARLLDELEEAAAALRTLEAELLALDSARSPALSGFRVELDEIAEGLRRQRAVHLEYQTRPG